LKMLDALAELPLANSDGEFQALRLSGRRRDYLAKLSDGSPVFLLHDVGGASATTSIELKYIDIQFHCTCRVTTSDEVTEDQFVMVRCSSGVPELHELFVCSLASLASELPDICDTPRLQKMLRDLLDLFRSLSYPSGGDIVGLWGELFVITRFRDVCRAIDAWRTGEFEKFDFSWGAISLEVKTTSGGRRSHSFSLDQLHGLPGHQVFVASLLLESSALGQGVLDLARQLDARLEEHAPMRRKLWSNVLRTLGSDFSNRLDRRFSSASAERSLIVYASSDIPAVSVPTDPRIRDVSFSVDLSSVCSTLSSSSRECFEIILKSNL
jgi:hypothetical protein